MNIRSIESAIAKAIPQDKCLHVIAGVIIFAVFHNVSWQAGMLAALLVGLAKELIDALTGGDVSFWDIVATSLGGLFGLACFWRFL